MTADHRRQPELGAIGPSRSSLRTDRSRPPVVHRRVQAGRPTPERRTEPAPAPLHRSAASSRGTRAPGRCVVTCQRRLSTDRAEAAAVGPHRRARRRRRPLHRWQGRHRHVPFVGGRSWGQMRRLGDLRGAEPRREGQGSALGNKGESAARPGSVCEARGRSPCPRPGPSPRYASRSSNDAAAADRVSVALRVPPASGEGVGDCRRKRLLGGRPRARRQGGRHLSSQHERREGSRVAADRRASPALAPRAQRVPRRGPSRPPGSGLDRPDQPSPALGGACSKLSLKRSAERANQPAAPARRPCMRRARPAPLRHRDPPSCSGVGTWGRRSRLSPSAPRASLAFLPPSPWW